MAEKTIDPRFAEDNPEALKNFIDYDGDNLRDLMTAERHEQLTKLRFLEASKNSMQSAVDADDEETEPLVFRVQDALASAADDRIELPDGVDMLVDFVEYKGYQVRESQRTIVDEAMEEFYKAVDADDDEDYDNGLDMGVHLQINAPVATGKSAAGVFIGLGLGQRTVLASSNKSLQDQYIQKDIPEIAEFLKAKYDYDLTYAIMKGQYNYANLINLREALDGKSEFEVFHNLDNQSKNIIEAIVDQSEMALEQVANTGRSDLLDVGNLIAQLPREMQRLACAASPKSKGDGGWLTWFEKTAPPEVNAETIEDVIGAVYAGIRAEEFDPVVYDSPYMTAFWLAMTADIAVVNQNLLIADLKRTQGIAKFVGEEMSYLYPSIVKGAGVIIVDEAQHYPAIVTSALSKSFSLASYESTVNRCIRRLSRAGLDGTYLDTLYKQFLQQLNDAHDKVRGSIEEDEDGDLIADAEVVVDTLSALQKTLYTTFSKIKKAESSLASMLRSKNASSQLVDSSKEDAKKGGKAHKSVERSRTDLDESIISPLYEFQPDEAWSVSTTEEKFGSNSDVQDYVVHMTPLNIRGHRTEVLEIQKIPNVYALAAGQRIWSGRYGTCMGIMSGTLSKLVGPKIGFPRGISPYISVDSPMDSSRARYCVPNDMPSPVGGDYMKWRAESAERVVEMVKLTAGRTMVLCTSNTTMNEYAAALRKKVPSVRVIAQNDMDKKAAIELFKLERNAVLLGVKSFWEGVDIPGDDLLLVIMDKIMFPIKDDHVYNALAEAEEESGGDAFINVQVDHAAFMFAQGAGRLQRTEKDIGGVLILDPRINNARYGSRVVSLAPSDAPFTRNYARFKKYMTNVCKSVDEGTNAPKKVKLTDDADDNWIALKSAGIKGTNRKPRSRSNRSGGQRRFD